MCKYRQQIRSCCGNTKLGTYIRKQRRTSHNQHNPTCGLCRIHKDVHQVSPFYFTINHHTDKKPIYHRHCSCFCRSENASINTPKDNHRHQKSPESIAKGFHPFPPGCLFHGWLDSFFPHFNHNYNYQCKTH